MQNRIVVSVIGLAMLLSASTGLGQVGPLDQETITLAQPVDSGWVTNDGSRRAVIFSDVVTVPDRGWIQVLFEKAVLGQQPPGGAVTVVRLTSLEDSAAQTLNTLHLQQWQDTSAYFNGDAVLVEIVADPGAEPSRVLISQVNASEAQTLGPIRSDLCGTDDRECACDPRVARFFPVGCTAYLIDDCSPGFCNHCFVSAGHCALFPGARIMQLNVPLSSLTGQIIHPHPDDQYVVDPASVRDSGCGAYCPGDDWMYFGCFVNPNTGLTPFEAQNDSFALDFDAQSDPPDAVRVTGFGSTVTSDCNPTLTCNVNNCDFGQQGNSVSICELHLAQKTHSGPFVGFGGKSTDPNEIDYTVDATGGDSGAPVIREDVVPAKVIGHHTNGRCALLGYNLGTAVATPGLQNAIWPDAQGVCGLYAELLFVYPAGIPDTLDSENNIVRVVVTGRDGNQPQPGTGQMFFRVNGGSFTTGTMIEIANNVYDADFNAIFDCNDLVEFYFTAETTTAVEVRDPLEPQVNYSANVVPVDEVFFDDFETGNTGWTVESENLSQGEWTLAIPDGNGGARGDPEFSFDYPSGSYCWVTGNGFDEDVDGGPTRLISPPLDLAIVDDPHVSYVRWFVNTQGDDSLEVEISNDGQTWIPVESVTDSDGWIARTFRVKDFIANPSAVVRVRFSTEDDPVNPSLVEAAIDVFSVFDVTSCGDLDPLPEGMNVVYGTLMSGDVNDLHASDDVDVVVRQQRPVLPALPHIRVEIDGHTEILDPLAVTVTVEAAVTSSPGLPPQRLSLYDYVRGTWIVIDNRRATSTDSVTEVQVIDDPDSFLESGTGGMQMRADWFDPGQVFSFAWDAEIDQAKWNVIPADACPECMYFIGPTSPGEEGFWNNPTSWRTGSCNGAVANVIPDGMNRAVICAGTTCVIDFTAVADSIEVQSNAVLIIRDPDIRVPQKGRLTLDGNGGTGAHVIHGEVRLANGGVLHFAETNHFVAGGIGGRIIGEDPSSEIRIAATRVLTSGVTIEGALKIRGLGFQSQTLPYGAFKNAGVVKANVAGQSLTLTERTIVSDTTPFGFAAWQAEAFPPPNGILHFKTEATGLVGDFDVDGGFLYVDEDVITCGLVQYCGNCIVVAPGKCFGGTEDPTQIEFCIPPGCCDLGHCAPPP